MPASSFSSAAPGKTTRIWSCTPSLPAHSKATRAGNLPSGFFTRVASGYTLSSSPTTTSSALYWAASCSGSSPASPLALVPSGKAASSIFITSGVHCFSAAKWMGSWPSELGTLAPSGKVSMSFLTTSSTARFSVALCSGRLSKPSSPSSFSEHALAYASTSASTAPGGAPDLVARCRGSLPRTRVHVASGQASTSVLTEPAFSSVLFISAFSVSAVITP